METFKKVTILTLVFLATAFVTLKASAHYGRGMCNHPLTPTATCYAAPNLSQLPQYTCCELLYKKHGVWHHAWRDTWVSGSCSNANPYARHDMGCDVNSPVYTTGRPIEGRCQFSDSTGKYL